MEGSSHPEKSTDARRELLRVMARGVVKTFGSTSVLRGIGFSLEAGSITVLTGQNGAGKSTLLSILSGERRPTRGQIDYVTRSGGVLEGRAARAKTGWVSHQPLAYLELSAEENLALVARLHGIPLSAVDRIAQRLGIAAFAKKPLSALSRGQLQRVALGRALVHQPDFLLLDEPWTGLDQAAGRFLEDLLREEAASGAIVFIVSHQRDVIAKLGARELVLRGGQLQDAATQSVADELSTPEL